ncbi:MAG: hypothetical protein LBR95_08555 [Azoarcus sp.]|nr:hypothetical protein [Azoarcus sp.]
MITDWFAAPSRQIEHIQAGGLELAAADVQALADAYAAHTSPTEGWIGSDLSNVIGSYWG